MSRLIIIVCIVCTVLASILLYTPLHVDVKVCSTDWGADCDQLEVVYGQSLYVYLQSNKPTEVSISVGDKTLVVPVDGVTQYELEYDTIKDHDMLRVNGLDVYYDVHHHEVTPDYYFNWDSEADQ